MTVCFLLYIEDTRDKSDGRVDLFFNDAAAHSAMEDAYARTLQTLRFNADSHSWDRYCICEESFAIIADGEDVYSWSIGQRKFLAAADCFAARRALREALRVRPDRAQSCFEV